MKKGIRYYCYRIADLKRKKKVLEKSTGEWTATRKTKGNQMKN